jgi:hypothetical protein
MFHELERLPVINDPCPAAHNPAVQRKRIQPVIHIAQSTPCINKQLMAIPVSRFHRRQHRIRQTAVIIKERAVDIKKQKHRSLPDLHSPFFLLQNQFLHPVSD